MHVAFVLLYKLNKGVCLDARQRSLKIGLDVYKHSTKIKNLWYFYHNETTINSSLPLHIHDAITTCTSMIVLSYLLLSFDLESGVGGQTGIKFQKIYKRFAYQLLFFFTYPLVRPKTIPCLSASPPLSPFSSSYLLTTEIVLCHGCKLAYYSIRQVHVYKVLIVNILLLEPHLKIWSLFNIRFLYFSVFQCSFLAPS